MLYRLGIIFLFFIIDYFTEVESCSSQSSSSSWRPDEFSRTGHILINPCERKKELVCSKAALGNGKENIFKMSMELYYGLRSMDKIKNHNLFFLPMEIASTISMVVDGTPNSQLEKADKASSLNDVRCYIRDLKKSLNKNVLVDTSVNSNYHKAVMMLIQRKMFADEDLKINYDFAQNTFCWYDVPINRLDFKDVKSCHENINEWVLDEATRAEKYITNLTSNKNDISEGHASVFHDNNVIQSSKVIIASSTILKLSWMNDLFSSANTEFQQLFHLGEKASDGSQSIVKVPFMKTVGQFPYIEKDNYKAIALPLDSSIHKGRAILVLPQEKASLDRVESKIISNNVVYNKFVQEMSWINNSVDNIEVLIPQLKVQISHEFSIPSNQKLKNIKDKDGHSISGDEVYVFQDTYLEMIESSNSKISLPEVKNDRVLKFDKPFLLFVEIRDDLIAFGRIMNPNECNNCTIKKEKEQEEFYIV
ncbi:serpin B6 [Lepeophtheirus salmonis]|uniref:serpin B6 n=1 Tax=Lepeophtheirus salmonis TaxID=72036 RepID=UPI001AEB5097|nr:serpin B6-like [Lepeophtheirus salmonis]